LDTKRLDLDAAKSRLKRAKSLQSRESVSWLQNCAAAAAVML